MIDQCEQQVSKYVRKQVYL